MLLKVKPFLCPAEQSMLLNVVRGDQYHYNFLLILRDVFLSGEMDNTGISWDIVIGDFSINGSFRDWTAGRYRAAAKHHGHQITKETA